MKRNYHTLDKRGKVNQRKLAEFLARNGQQILPMVELITESRMAIDDLVEAMGRATIETVLQLSAEQVAGPPQQGRRRAEEIFWHGKQAGSVYLKERKLKVQKPRLRKKGGGVQAEVAVPAYEAMQDQAGMGSRMLDILLEGVSTRQYGAVIPKMARHGGGFEIQRQPGSHSSLGSTTRQTAEPPFRRRGSVNHLRRWHALRRSMRDWSDRGR